MSTHMVEDAEEGAVGLWRGWFGENLDVDWNGLLLHSAAARLDDASTARGRYTHFAARELGGRMYWDVGRMFSRGVGSANEGENARKI